MIPRSTRAATIGYLGQELTVGATGRVSVEPHVQVSVTGWHELEGVMVTAPEPEFNAGKR